MSKHPVAALVAVAVVLVFVIVLAVDTGIVPRLTGECGFTVTHASPEELLRTVRLDVIVSVACLGIGPYGYNWNFGDGTYDSRDVSSVQHTYMQDGSYLVVLQVESGGGVRTFSRTVTIST